MDSIEKNELYFNEHGGNSEELKKLCCKQAYNYIFNRNSDDFAKKTKFLVEYGFLYSYFDKKETIKYSLRKTIKQFEKGSHHYIVELGEILSKKGLTKEQIGVVLIKSLAYLKDVDSSTPKRVGQVFDVLKSRNIDFMRVATKVEQFLTKSRDQNIIGVYDAIQEKLGVSDKKRAQMLYNCSSLLYNSSAFLVNQNTEALKNYVLTDNKGNDLHLDYKKMIFKCNSLLSAETTPPNIIDILNLLTGKDIPACNLPQYYSTKYTIDYNAADFNFLTGEEAKSLMESAPSFLTATISKINVNILYFQNTLSSLGYSKENISGFTKSFIMERPQMFSNANLVSMFTNCKTLVSCVGDKKAKEIVSKYSLDILSNFSYTFEKTYNVLKDRQDADVCLDLLVANYDAFVYELGKNIFDIQEEDEKNAFINSILDKLVIGEIKNNNDDKVKTKTSNYKKSLTSFETDMTEANMLLAEINSFSVNLNKCNANIEKLNKLNFALANNNLDYELQSKFYKTIKQLTNKVRESLLNLAINYYPNACDYQKYATEIIENKKETSKNSMLSAKNTQTIFDSIDKLLSSIANVASWHDELDKTYIAFSLVVDDLKNTFGNIRAERNAHDLIASALYGMGNKGLNLKKIVDVNKSRTDLETQLTDMNKDVVGDYKDIFES